MTFDIDGQLQQLLLGERLTDEGIGSHQSRHDRRGTAAQPPCRRHGKTHPCLKGDGFQPSRFPHPLGRSVNEVLRPTPEVTAFRSLNNQLKSFTAPFDPPHREAVVQIKGCTEAVKSGAEIGGGCRDVHDHFLTDARLRHR